MRVRVWLDDFYLYIEIVNKNNETVTHEQYGNVLPFTKQYVEDFLTYLVGECTIEYM